MEVRAKHWSGNDVTFSCTGRLINFFLCHENGSNILVIMILAVFSCNTQSLHSGTPMKYIWGNNLYNSEIFYIRQLFLLLILNSTPRTVLA